MDSVKMSTTEDLTVIIAVIIPSGNNFSKQKIHVYSWKMVRDETPNGSYKRI